jgi:hypothetical protein
MQRSTLLVCLCALALLGCDKQPAPSDSKAGDKGVASKPESEQPSKPEAEQPTQPEAEQPVDDTKGFASVVRTFTGEAPASVTDAPSYDTSKNAGGLIGHLATALAHDDELASSPVITELHVLAGELEPSPSDAAVCEHVWTEVLLAAHTELADKHDVFKHDCKIEIERQRIKLGVEIFAQHASCVVAAKDLAAVDRCDAAEQQAEQWLHQHPKGDQPERTACVAAVEHFVVLLNRAMIDDPDMVEVLQEDIFSIKDDAVLACHDEATAVELQCILKAADLKGLEVCLPSAQQPTSDGSPPPAALAP